MKARQKRMIFIAVGLAGLAIAATFVMKAFNSNMMYFISPSQIKVGEVPRDRNFRLGGLVLEGSLKREDDGLTVHFVVTDGAQEIPVIYTGILPDLFTEGQGVVAVGRLDAEVFLAEEVLAKHDETYMPPEVADALEKAKQGGEASAPVKN
ncbi:MAG: cytochrome c biogenesis protein CcmE [Gammaproteobacteria bacterium RBG_16_57_12]|nr:MAG: cytochrome c biogenesis protein CcmE [Gammaproteobacteria bacterium RBG_16_57_12]